MKTKNSNPDTSDSATRLPAVAGRFYSSDPQELIQEIEDCYQQASKRQVDNLRAIIVPHAGYIFSGTVAASAYNQIGKNAIYEAIFIIGASHQAHIGGASVFNGGFYATPLGRVGVRSDIADKLINNHSVFCYDSYADSREHSLEVQLPFLQQKLGNNIQIVPIIIGTEDPIKLQEIADALRPYFNKTNLFVISTDFSHYPTYIDAIDNDNRTMEALVKNDISIFKDTLVSNDLLGIEDLKTSACGATALEVLLHLAARDDNYCYHPINYKNSGDVSYGDKTRVVGYWAMAVTNKNEEHFFVAEADKVALLTMARDTLRSYISSRTLPDWDDEKLTPFMHTLCGMFVSLHKNGQLRGCIGRFGASMPLYRLVQEMAVAAGTQDPRFLPLDFDELHEVSIEISILTPMRKISNIDELELGRHGIYIKKGHSTGTFLPQVATETGWSKLEFIEHCSEGKARIGKDGWKDAELFTYEAIVFHE